MPHKDYPLIATELYCKPWSILSTAHAEICRQFQAHCEAGAPDLSGGRGFEVLPVPGNAADDPVGPGWRDSETGKFHPWHSQVTMIGSIAILPVRGIIGKHVSLLGLICGGCDSAVIAKQAKNIAADDRVTHCIVYLDTPGGACVGAPEAARAIQSIGDSGKKSIAYTDTMAASNGYFFASACQDIIAAPSAIVGSISTYCAYLDQSRAFEMEGLETLVFRTGDKKGIGTPGKAFTEVEKEFLQEMTDQFGAQFKGYVSERRGLSAELMQGQYWPAEFAPVGVVDAFADDLQEVIDAIQRSQGF